MSQLPNADSRPVGLTPRADPPPDPSAGILACLVGALASVFQVLLLREFTAQFYGSELAFGFVLAFWLLWGGLGSRVASKRGLWSAEACLLASVAGAPAGFALLRLSGPILGLLPGEVTGFGPILAFAAAASAPTGFFLGAAFARVAALTAGGPAVAYRRESAGAAIAATAAYAVLLPLLPAGAVLATAGAAGAGVVFFLPGATRRRPHAAAAAVLCLLAAFLDAPSHSLRWRPFAPSLTEDGLYGRVQSVPAADEVTVYGNGLKAYSSGDRTASREAAGFALLQRPPGARVLILGNGFAGLAAEALRLGSASVEVVEADATLVRAVGRSLPAEERSVLADSRVRWTIADGRSFLRRSTGGYDVILVDQADPATAQVNRFFTAEFYKLAAERLAPSGVLSFRLGAAENYVGPLLARHLATQEATLRSAFPQAEIVPGAAAVFLASRGPLTIDPDRLADELERRAEAVPSFNRALLRARLHPLRRERLRASLDAAAAGLNSDDRPIAYFLHSRLWSVQKRGFDAALLGRLESLSPALLLAAAFAPLLLAAAVSAGRSRLRPPGPPPAYPFFILGLTTMAAELLLFIRWQTLHGGLYGRVSLLLGLFMAGTTAGAWLGSRIPIRGRASVLAPPAAAALLLAASAAGLDKRLGGTAFSALFALWGAWGGFFFSALSRAFPVSRIGAGKGYAADLLGSFAGALVIAAILMPLLGLDRLFAALAAVNLALLAALAAYRRGGLPRQGARGSPSLRPGPIYPIIRGHGTE